MSSPTPPDGPLEARLHRLLDAVADHAIYMLDCEGRITTWNAAAERLKGYSASEIIGRHYSVFFTPEDREAGAPDKALESARDHGRFEAEGWRVRKNGERRWVLATLSAIRDEAGHLTGFAKVTRDMTERRAAQVALMESERRFRLLVQGVVDYAIYMLDPQGIITNWNAGARRIKGYDADEVIGRHFSKFFTEPDLETGLPERSLARALAEGRYEAEGWRLRKDGSRFWANVVIDPIRDEQGELLGFAKITRDITERRAAQTALMESERQFRLLVANVTDYALYMLDTNGVITNWNAGAQLIKGYGAHEVIGQHFSRFFTEADKWSELPTRALSIAAETGRHESEGWRVRKDGSLFWASAVIDAIRDETGELIGFAKITRDITERREAQIKLQEAQERVAQLQKMEALGQLTGGVAHDFNNLLMIVSGHAQLLKLQQPDNEKFQRSIEAIEFATQRGETLTRQLLTFARRQRLNPTSIDLTERITAFSQVLRNSVRSDIEFATDLPDGLWTVEADLSELELALVNLTVNARDAMPDGGLVTLSAQNVSLQPGQVGELQGDFVALSVTDTGTGIPPDILAKVFEPFFTTKQVNKGTGLGLSQVYGFAHQSGGDVTIASEIGQGARITFYLPRTRAAPSSVQETSVEAPNAPGGTVLLVEDNPDVALVSAEMLKQLGYQVRVATNAEQALEALKEPCDLVFSDIVMAGPMDGLALARRLREELPGTPILLASGYSKAAEAARSEFPILRKPYQMAELGRAVGRLLQTARRSTDGDNLVRLGEERRRREGRPA